MIPCNFKLVLFFAKSFNKPLKGYIKDRRLNLTLGLSYYVSFSSSLQSHSLWVTLYKVEHFNLDCYTAVAKSSDGIT